MPLSKTLSKEIVRVAKKIVHDRYGQEGCTIEEDSITVKPKKKNKYNFYAETKNMFLATVPMKCHGQIRKFQCEMKKEDDGKVYGFSWWGVDPCREINPD